MIVVLLYLVLLVFFKTFYYASWVIGNTDTIVWYADELLWWSEDSRAIQCAWAVRAVSQTGPTGHGGPVPTGQTGIPTGQSGPGALVTYQSSPEPIASIPPVQTDFSWKNRFTGYCVPPYATMTYNPYTMSPQSLGFSYSVAPNNGYL